MATIDHAYVKAKFQHVKPRERGRVIAIKVTR
jgi:hypothetical protein